MLRRFSRHSYSYSFSSSSSTPVALSNALSGPTIATRIILRSCGTTDCVLPSASPVNMSSRRFNSSGSTCTDGTDKKKEEATSDPTASAATTTAPAMAEKEAGTASAAPANEQTATAPVAESKGMLSRFHDHITDGADKPNPAQQPPPPEQDTENRKSYYIIGAGTAFALAAFFFYYWWTGTALRQSLLLEPNTFERNGDILLERTHLAPRETGDDMPHWASKHGCTYAGHNGCEYSITVHDTYWNEAALYTVSESLATELQVATFWCYNALLETVQEICEDSTGALFAKLGYEPWLFPLFVNSWYHACSKKKKSSTDPDSVSREADLLSGRFDFIIDSATGIPKMLEINAQTPTVCLEASILQRMFHKEVLPTMKSAAFAPPLSSLSGSDPSTYEDPVVKKLASYGQANWIEASLFGAFRRYFRSSSLAAYCDINNTDVYFVFEGQGDHEVRDTLNFLRAIAVKCLPAEMMKRNSVPPKTMHFSQLEATEEYANGTRDMLVFSHFPYEALLGETAGSRCVEQGNAEIERMAANRASDDVSVAAAGGGGKLILKQPLWSMLVTSKAMLPLLYERYPNSKYLAPAAFLSESPEQAPLEIKQAMDDGGSGLVAKPFLGREGVGVLLSHDHIYSVTADKRGMKKHLHKLKEKFKEKKQQMSSSSSMSGSVSECIKAFWAFAQNEEKRHLDEQERRNGSIAACVRDRYVVQNYVDSPSLHGKEIIVGSWVVAGQPAGFGIREDLGGNVTKNHSSFVPHVVRTDQPRTAGAMLTAEGVFSEELRAMLTPSPAAAFIREMLYGANGVEFDATRLEFALGPQDPGVVIDVDERRRRRRRFFAGGGGGWGSSNSNSNSSNAEKKDGSTSRKRPPPPPTKAQAHLSKMNSGSSGSSSMGGSGSSGARTSRPAPKPTGSYMSHGVHSHGGG